MYTKVYWVHQFDNNARLGIMARPRGNDWLQGEIDNLNKQNISLLVSLLEPEEIATLELENEETVCKRKGIEFLNFPIPDRDTPKSDPDVTFLINHLFTALEKGNSVTIHCRMGIGRSSIIAAAVLLKSGLKADAVINHITSVRGLKVPDTNKQLYWIKTREQIG